VSYGAAQPAMLPTRSAPCVPKSLDRQWHGGRAHRSRCPLRAARSPGEELAARLVFVELGVLGPGQCFGELGAEARRSSAVVQVRLWRAAWT
jgi:hypothetical protein